MMTDEQLMRQFQAGDNLAFEELDNRWRSRLVGFFMRKNAESMADDLAQVTLLKVFQRRAQFNETCGAFSTWIMRIATNALIDAVRSNKRKHRGGDFVRRSLDGVEVAGRDHTEEIEAADYQDETEAVIEEAIKLLPRKLRQIVNGVRLGNRMSEISETVGISTGTAKKRFDEAIVRMRRVIECNESGDLGVPLELVEQSLGVEKTQLTLF